MSARRQFNDCYVNAWVAEVDASAAQNGTVNSATFDTNQCYAPTINVRVRALAQNKKIKLKLQDSDENNAGWADVVNTTGYGLKTDMNPDTEISANGGLNYFYAGQKRYIRVVVTSVDAAPAAKLDILFQKHMLASKPRNTGF